MEIEQLRSFIEVPENSDFTIYNIPYGVFQQQQAPPRCCTAIGEYVVDLSVLEERGLFDGELFSGLKANGTTVFNQPNLNAFMSLDKEYWSEARRTLQSLLGQDSKIRDDKELQEKSFHKGNTVTMVLPVNIGDYTDFYSSRQHAFNMGSIIRGPENALQPNWVHIPVGYHGRASSIVISGTDIIRPHGQIKPPTQETPIFSECKRLDFELEVGAFLGGKLNQQGHPIHIKNAQNHIFGFVLLNDWSARDIQAWEYVPLGPFNAKNFSSVISPWIVTAHALEPFRVSLSPQTPQPLPYLRDPNLSSYDLQLEVLIQPQDSEHLETIVKSNFKYLYWSVAQQLTHHAVTGCNMNPGDLLGSGTISGNEKDSFGSLFELSWGGKETIKLTDGQERTFLKDGDLIVMRGYAQKNGVRIGFGECRSRVKPALPLTEYE